MLFRPKRIRTKILVVFYIITAIPLAGYLILFFQLKEQNTLTTRFIEQEQPITLSWTQLMNGVNRSLAAQRGWVLFGSETFKADRLAAWSNDIEPALESLKTLYSDPEIQVEQAEAVRAFYDVRLSLIELKNIQEKIQTTARTSKNIPAQQLFDSKIEPAFQTSIQNLEKLLQASPQFKSQAVDYLNVLFQLQASFWQSFESLKSYVQHGHLTAWEQYQQFWQTQERWILAMQGFQPQFLTEHQSHFRQFLKNVALIDQITPRVFEQRKQPNWNLASHMMEKEAIPLVRQVEEVIKSLVSRQTQAAQNTNRHLQEEYQRWQNLFLSVAAGVFCLGVFLSGLLGRQVVVPLRELRDAVRKVKTDDFDGTIDVYTQDEVGELAQEFREMLQVLSERTHDANQSRQILENSPFPVMLATPERELLYINPAAVREFKKLADFLPAPPENMQGHNIHFLIDPSPIEDRQLSTPYALPPTTDISLGDQIIEVTFSPLFDGQQQYIGPVLHWKNATIERRNEQDRVKLVSELQQYAAKRQSMVTQLESQNQKLRDQLHLDQAHAKIANAISTLEVSDILQTALETLVKTTNSQIGVIYLYSKSQQALEVSHHYTVDAFVMSDEFYQAQGLPTHIYQSKEPVTIKHPSPEQGQALHLGVTQSYPDMIVGYPLLMRQETLGVLLLASVSELSDSTIRFIENTVPQLSVSIHNALTFQMVQQQQQYLQTANIELEAATRLKSEFLANMSHELRTPLNAIIGFTEAILDVDEENPLNDYQEDRLKRVHKSGKHLLELINSILDLSKIEAGKMQVHSLDFEPLALCQEIIGLMESLIANKPVALNLEADGEIPTCHTDSDKLRQIIINLLGNAIKFTAEGEVTLSLKADDTMLHVAVQDTGCGIPESQLGQIFESFRQVDGSETRQYEGTGLGLSLVKSMSQLLGGDVSATSEEGKGSTFTVQIPMHLQTDT